jgi:hypothetical protein
MGQLRTLSDMQAYRQKMLDGIAKHGWLAYNFPTDRHAAVADLLVADGLIAEVPDEFGRRRFEMAEATC